MSVLWVWCAGVGGVESGDADDVEQVLSTQARAQRKRELRARLRAARRALPAAVQRRHGLQFAAQVLRQSWFQRCRRVGLYLPDDGELDVLPLIRLCWRLGKRVYLPRLRARGVMEFALYRQGDTLRRGKHGIREPQRNAPVLAPADLDVVFTPLVGFTGRGERLGRGGGYYDRLFAERPGAVFALVGVAHELQRVDEPSADDWADDWDVGLCGVITETGAIGPPFGISKKLTRKSLRPQ